MPFSAVLDVPFPGFADAATALTVAFNQDLAAALNLVESQLPIRIHRVDVFALFNEIITDPSRFGFTNVSDACMQPVGDLAHDVIVGGDPCPDADRFVFWDSIHPTSAAHALLAAAAVSALIPLPSTLLLVGTGLIAVVACRRRRRRVS